MTRRYALIGVRLFFSVLVFAAVTVQLFLQVQADLSVLNFFSFFTILSSLFAAFVMLMGAVYLIQHREPSHRNELARGASVAGMVVVGVVFSLLLRGVDLGPLRPWINTVVHHIMPVVVVLDWLFQPPRTRLFFREIQHWLIFPLLYLAYTLVRGARVDWYPYPFLNPAGVGGYGGVLLYSVAILAMFLGASWILIVTGNRLSQHGRNEAQRTAGIA
jgi:hypothetical protein